MLVAVRDTWRHGSDGRSPPLSPFKKIRRRQNRRRQNRRQNDGAVVILEFASPSSRLFGIDIRLDLVQMTRRNILRGDEDLLAAASQCDNNEDGDDGAATGNKNEPLLFLTILNIFRIFWQSVWIVRGMRLTTLSTSASRQIPFRIDWSIQKKWAGWWSFRFLDWIKTEPRRGSSKIKTTDLEFCIKSSGSRAATTKKGRPEKKEAEVPLPPRCRRCCRQRPRKWETIILVIISVIICVDVVIAILSVC